MQRADNSYRATGVLVITGDLMTAATLSSPVSVGTQDFCRHARGNDPIRSEMFGLERIEAHAKQLAEWAVVDRHISPQPLRQRFAESSRAFLLAHKRISEAYQRKEKFGPDADWLLDNFHIVSDALKEIRTDLPGGYYKLLPRLARPPLAGYPRVYAIALELVCHCDSSLDESNIVRFVQAFQSVAPLTIGELWAVPIMLRLVLVENLRRLAQLILDTQSHGRHATAWTSHLLGLDESSKRVEVLRTPPGHLHPHSQWTDSFIVQLYESLRDQGGALTAALDWLENFLLGRGLSSVELVRHEQQFQAANQVSIGNSVTSLRVLSVVDWSAFFERTSLVEKILREDLAGAYALQDFPTRDHYRRVVEKLSRGSNRDELEVARAAVEMARQATTKDAGASGPSDHVGYYLVDQGARKLERHLRYVPALRDRAVIGILEHPLPLYFGALVAVLILVMLALGSFTDEGVAWFSRCLILTFALLPASEIAIALVNQMVSWLVPPRTLAKFRYQEGIPAESSTFVVMPTLLFQPQSASLLVERLEVHYLSNPDPALRFALLTDFADAPAEHQDRDAAILEAASARITALNEKYCAGGPHRFFLCHRRRQWNPVQGCWMGWERKRGKLLEFNRLLRGDRETSFAVVTPDLGSTQAIRYVITLDADTQLPREAAQRMVATLAHPLNHPRLDAEQKRVVSGYALLQPRVSLLLPAAYKSVFARVYMNSAGLDPYTTAVSDTYQDLFGEGTYTGKGIYHVDAFAAAVDHRFPDNRVLSHDLIEGNFARCGLASDIELFDDFPASYAAYARREHRWMRGDWQILSWIFPRVPNQAGILQPNPLPVVARWKILDNLRRSLVPPSLLLLLALCWLLAPGSIPACSAFVLAVLGWRLVVPLLSLPFRFTRSLIRGNSPDTLPQELPGTAGQVVFESVLLAERALLMVDAVARTLTRLFITHRNLLEWETAALTEKRLRSSSLRFSREMALAPGLALILLLAIWALHPGSLVWAAPALAFWFLSPLLAWWVSRPLVERTPDLSAQDRRQLRLAAVRIWSFFETFVGQQDHWLPPDNYQASRQEPIAHRTSPTNVGFYLASALAAHDFGYLSVAMLVERLNRTFETLIGMDKVHGHFYNWYDTLTLRPLHPPYLSTVDSGNLLACLIALKHGLLGIAEKNSAHDNVWPGLGDMVEASLEELRGLEAPKEGQTLDLVTNLEARLQEMARQLADGTRQPGKSEATLGQLEAQAKDLPRLVDELAGLLDEVLDELKAWTLRLNLLIQAHQAEIRFGIDHLTPRLRELADLADRLATEMDFQVLYNQHRNLFAVGYNISLGRLDNSHYDLLASEASLTSFLAVARGEVAKKHWFQLGRHFTQTGGSTALLSWGGTMFEYLMPRLFLPQFSDSLLNASQKAAVQRHIDYGRERHVPWGISESAFSVMDADMNYQYQAFGVPGLGLKRGLGKDLVIAPYATMLAVTVCPSQVAANLRRLAREGAAGTYGFYEALDYTPERLEEKNRPVSVQCFMAHHQGMALVALCNGLLDNPMVRRFQAEPMVRATELLLQERVPQDVELLQPGPEEHTLPTFTANGPRLLSRRLSTPHTLNPRVHLLSSGQYTVMLTNAGGGYSTCQGLDVTRWREDRTCDAWGQFVYIKNLADGNFWSAGYQPTRREADEYEVVYSIDKAEFRRVDDGIETHMEVTVSPENHAEIRRITLTNHTSRRQSLEVTSYAEIVLAPRAADMAHPAFGKLFIETEFIPSEHCLLAQRRPRTPEEVPIWGVHVLAVEGQPEEMVQFETDRMRFIGRQGTLAHPQALAEGASLSGTVGSVLDPVFSLRRRVVIAPDASVILAFTTATANSRPEALALGDHYHDFHGIARAFELAWAHSQVELRHLHLTAEEAHLYQRLAGHVLFAGPALRAGMPAAGLTAPIQPVLWRLGISGDNPIVLARVGETEHVALVRQLVAAHAYWRSKCLIVDLVILNEHETGYFEELQQQLETLVRASDERALVDKPGGVFIRKTAHIPRDEQMLLEFAARCVFAGSRGSLENQIDRRAAEPSTRPEPLRLSFKEMTPESGSQLSHSARPETLLFFNGLGGFSTDGREYVIRLSPAIAQDEAARRRDKSIPTRALADRLRVPPAPWVNVVANPRAGFVISESGGGYTWAENSQANRSTPWHNDPVCDSPSEVIYVRDEATGETWSATPRPLPLPAAYTVRHGQGYTLFQSGMGDLIQELLLVMSPADPVKSLRLLLRNQGQRTRRLSVTFFVEWVVGTLRSQAPMRVVCEVDAETGAIVARNRFDPQETALLAFADVDYRPRAATTDQTAFLGRNGSIERPVGLGQVKGANAAPPGSDPCAVLQTGFELKSGEDREIVFFLGQAAGVEEMRGLLRAHKERGTFAKIHNSVRENWDSLLDKIQVKTPNLGLDLLLNRWLIYQVQSCRLWARTGYYQSSGAYGFRDQLQDVMALFYAAPQEARAHILRAASRQFNEGDVQHWWHPGTGAGVRTRVSDDYLWLPYVVCHYVSRTGDYAILDETVPFLHAPLLRPEQVEDFRAPSVSDQVASLYEHCTRAIENGFRTGPHGLPLIGTGDWNDGMNRVGPKGQGESVWNGWFLCTILSEFAQVAERRGDHDRTRAYREKAEALRKAIEQHGWDGKWYRRAYFDDGTPLGSSANDECRIDSITQTWAVISQAADPERARQAMDAVEESLVHNGDKLIELFTPPFAEGKLEPGYIKGYVPGIRENGGQYTHAATWVALATALLGKGTRAMELLDLLNPINHTSDPAGVNRYRVEPYVLAGDVYSETPHAGRGGWTWYTGSAGWFYRIALENILGFQCQGNQLSIKPCIPAEWHNYQITYRYHSATYVITVENPDHVETGSGQMWLDNQPVDGPAINMVDDGREHSLRVKLAKLGLKSID
jgi:cyclic beta-1,2-glucan synthetase